MNDKELERNIILNAYYMINLYNKKEVNDNQKEDSKINSSITNLKLQKLLYFVEAYFLVENSDEKELFSTEWSAWDYGPVNKELYNHFKNFGGLELMISDDEAKLGNNIPKRNKKYIEKICRIFGGLTAFNLVTLTHLANSPWDKIYQQNKLDKNYNFQLINDSVIPKDKTRDWFEETFSFIFKNDDKSGEE